MGTIIITAIVVLWCVAMVPAVLAPFFLDRPKQTIASQQRPTTLPFRQSATPSRSNAAASQADNVAA